MIERSRLCTIGRALVAGAVLFDATLAGAAGPTVVYDATPAVVPGNVPSLGYEATSTREFGDLVRLGAGGRRLDRVTVTMSSWGCEGGDWTGTSGTCLTTSGATFSHPLTIKVYAVAPGGGPGVLLASKTTTFVIPYRPSSDPINCPGTPTQWYDATNLTCYNGLATPVTWDFSADPPVIVPSKVIWTVAYDTSDYGVTPLRPAPCNTEDGGCGYDSLNVGAQTFPGAAFVGQDLDPDGAFLDSLWAGAYCDSGAGGTGVLRLDTGPPSPCWTGYTPLAEIRTVEIGSTVVVTPSANAGWGFIANGDVAVTTNNARANIVAGPGGQPGGLLAGSVYYDTNNTPGGKPQLYAPSSLAGTKFIDLTSLDYSTLISRYATDPGGNHLTPVLNVKIDLDGSTLTTADQATLVYEPCYSLDGCVGAVQPLDTWTTWHPLAPGQKWWSTATIPGTAFVAFASYVPLDSLYLAHPDATVLWLSVNAGNSSGGAPWNNFTGSLDGVSIGIGGTSTLYDFEPLPGATPGSIVVSSAALKLSKVANPNGSARIAGTLNATDTQVGFENAATSGGMTLRIRDAAGFDATVPVTGCVVTGSRRNVVCRSVDRAVTMRFRAVVGPFLGRFVYALTGNVLKLTPAQTGATPPVAPITVTLHESPGIDRTDTVGDRPEFPCRVNATSLSCRER